MRSRLLPVPLARSSKLFLNSAPHPTLSSRSFHHQSERSSPKVTRIKRSSPKVTRIKYTDLLNPVHLPVLGSSVRKLPVQSQASISLPDTVHDATTRSLAQETPEPVESATPPRRRRKKLDPPAPEEPTPVDEPADVPKGGPRKKKLDDSTPEKLPVDVAKPRARRKKHEESACVEDQEDVPKPRRRRKKPEPSHVVEIDPSIYDGTTTAALTKPTTRRRKATEAPTFNNGSSVPTSPLAIDIMHNLTQFPHCILVTRIGQFYESYFDQAEEVAKLLSIKLTTRRWGGNGNRVAMCGFPLPHLDKHLKTLVQVHGRCVAMCEEFRRPGQEKEFDRRVVRIVTPGTLFDESFLNPYDNNYLLSINVNSESLDLESAQLGLAWIDVSTGEVFSSTASYDTLQDDLARISPREIVLDESLQAQDTHPLQKALSQSAQRHFISYAPQTPLKDTQPTPLPAAPSDAVITGLDAATEFVSSFAGNEQSAISLLTSFLRQNLLEHMPVLSLPSRESTSSRMQIDAHTIRALEIKASGWSGSKRGTLLNTIRRNITAGGSRLLARWLTAPSTSAKEINARLSLVAFFIARPHLHADVLTLLVEAADVTRIVQRFLLGRGDVGDLRTVASTVDYWRAIHERIRLEKTIEFAEATGGVEWASLEDLFSRLVDLSDLSARIGSALTSSSFDNEDVAVEGGAEEVSSSGLPQPALTLNTSEIKWTICPEFSPHLAALHQQLKSLIDDRLRLETTMQTKFNAPSLTLRNSPGLGMHVHLARKKDQAGIVGSPNFVAVQESGATKSFVHQDWSRLGNRILETTSFITSAEREVFETLRAEVTSRFTHLRRNARVFDELDALMGFAKLAQEMNFTRPMVTEDTSYHIVNGRHPTVEQGLLESGRSFVPNTVTLDESSRVRLHTGPNMAGKSTLLRQTALIAILGQAGSYVPADIAQWGVVDRVFSRVGAHDDLFQDQSTFMVEMIETAEILRSATPRSLVIMDEVGRGTTVNEGLAIAFATLHHLVTVSKSRVLFATHFHELADMLGYDLQEKHRGSGLFSSVSFYCSDVDETEDHRITYSYRVQPGLNRESHGLKVAQIANMPTSAMDIASQALSLLKRQHERDRAPRARALQDLGQLVASS